MIISNKNFCSKGTLLLSIIFIYLLSVNLGYAEDISAVFQDMTAKTDSIMNYVINGLIYFLALCAFIGWCIAMLFKKVTYVEGIVILIIIILIGFAPTIVKALMQKS